MRVQVTDTCIGVESSDGTLQVCIVTMQNAVDGAQGYVDLVKKKPGDVMVKRFWIGGYPWHMFCYRRMYRQK